MDDLWRLRLRRDGFLLPDRGAAGSGAPAFLGKVVSTGTSLGVGKFMKVNPVDATGAETESGAGTLTADASKTVLVYALGPTAPATGDYVVCRHVNHRWVADKQTPGGGTSSGYEAIPNCFCTTTPDTITMTSCSTSCNFSMFQPCTIQYQPTPAWAAGLGLGASCFLSNETFPDPIAGGAMFHYLLDCFGNTYSLTRIYQTSPYGSPFRDSVLYQWDIGATGNSCTAWRLVSGSPFSGSDATCCVTLFGGSGSGGSCVTGLGTIC